jgi:hypothetical protein
MAHDEKNEAKIGDKVVIVETRPISAKKRFKMDRIIERGGARFEETDAVADVAEEVIEPVADSPLAKAKPAAKTAKPKENDK